jgi:hypothetical protein
MTYHNRSNPHHRGELRDREMGIFLMSASNVVPETLIWSPSRGTNGVQVRSPEPQLFDSVADRLIEERVVPILFLKVFVDLHCCFAFIEEELDEAFGSMSAMCHL